MNAIAERVGWWMNDMAFKPPEIISEDTAHGMWYHLCFAKDILQVANDKLDFAWSSRRLDPPREWMR
jgi:hypothetical protein